MSNAISLTGLAVDGRQLSFPGTGLAVVASELLAALAESAQGRPLRVFIEAGVDPSNFDLASAAIEWVPITWKRCRPDYIDRLSWSRALLRAMAKLPPARLFIPYLYNYGRCAENLVLVPDLLYRAYPDYGFRPPGAKWWSLRGRLPLRPWVRSWEERRAARAARVIVYSEYVREEVQRHLAVPRSRISLIPLAPPRWMTQPASAPSNPAAWPARFALYAGGYAARKNVSLLLEACYRVHEIDSSFRCVFVGWNSAGSSPSRLDRCPAIVPTPSLSNAQLADACRRCEFALYPSHAEGFGLPVIEAAACGKLCLCGDNTSLREIQLPAFRLPSTEMDPWVREILRYWRDPTAAHRAGAACHENSLRFKWETAAQTLWHLATH